MSLAGVVARSWRYSNLPAEEDAFVPCVPEILLSPQQNDSQLSENYLNYLEEKLDIQIERQVKIGRHTVDGRLVTPDDRALRHPLFQGVGRGEEVLLEVAGCACTCGG